MGSWSRWALLLGCALLAGCQAPASPASAPDQALEPPEADGGEGGAGPAFRLPALMPAPGNSVGGGQEPSILADRNGRFVWIATSTDGLWSADNGTTWHEMEPFKLPGGFIDGWALAQDQDGRLYAAALQGSETSVARSSDGMTWDATTHAVALSGVTDRPWMAAHGSGATAQVVLFYYDYPVGEYCARSTNAGATWLDRNPLAGPAQGGRAFFDASGDFYYVSDDAVMYRFDGACGLGTGQAIRLIDGAGVNNMVQGTADGEDLYVAAATSSSREVTLAGRHADGRQRSLVVSPPQLSANTFVTVAVRGDLAAVAWYGSTGSGNPSGTFTGDWNVYLALVRGFWSDAPAVSHLQLTQQPNHRGTICMGGIGCTGGRELLDYFMVDLDIWGGAHVAYVDDLSGNGGTYYAHVPPAVAPGPTPATGQPPDARFVAFADGLDVDVDATLSKPAPGVDLKQFSWSWGDGSTGSGAVAEHAYARPGKYTITLNVTDSAGLTGTRVQTVSVEGEPSPASSAPAGTTSGTGTAEPASKVTVATSEPDSSSPGAGQAAPAPGTPLPAAIAIGALAAALALARRSP